MVRAARTRGHSLRRKNGKTLRAVTDTGLIDTRSDGDDYTRKSVAVVMLVTAFCYLFGDLALELEF